MSSNQGRKNQRPAERLSVVLDSGAGILTRLRDVAATTGNSEKLKEMPWIGLKRRVVSAELRKRFPEYPNLTDVSDSATLRDLPELRSQAGGICQRLEPMYLVLHDSMELHTQVAPSSASPPGVISLQPQVAAYAACVAGVEHSTPHPYPA